MLENIVRSGLAVLLTATVLGPATASAQGPQPREPHFLGGLAADLDTDGDGVISREEYNRGADVFFTELDKNGDGALSEDELPRLRGPRHGRGSGMGRPGMGRGAFGGMLLVRGADGDGDGAVTNEEWQGFLDALEPAEDGTINEESLRAAMPPPPGMAPMPEGGRGPSGRPGRLTRLLDRDGDSVLEVDDLEAAFAELDQDGDGALAGDELPSFRGRRPGGPPGR